MEGLAKFTNDPEWHLIEELLSRNTESLKDVSTLDINLPAETIKAIVAGRQETLRLVENFHRDVEASRGITKNVTSFK